MNKTTNVILGVIVAAAIIGGIYYASTKKTDTMVTPTPASVQTPTAAPAGQAANAPSVSTKSANFISQSTAVLNAEINPNGAQTSYWYEYGTTQTLGSRTNVQLLGAGRVTYSAPGYISGLKANTTYYFRAVAENAKGRVSGSVASFSTTMTPPVPGNPPVAETSSASEIATDGAILNGHIDPQNSKTYFWFEYGTDLSLGNTTSSSTQNAGTGTVAIAKEINDLAPSTVYYFRLNAQNGYGTDNGAIRSFTTKSTTPPPAPAGDEPTADTDPATAITDDGATLNGNVNPNGADTTYWFEYGRSTLLGVFDLDKQTSEKSAGAGKTVKTFSQSISGLAADSTYYFRIVSKNKFGTDSGSVHRFTTKK